MRCHRIPTLRGGAARWKRLAVGGWEYRRHDVVLPLPYGHHAAAAASQPFTMPAVPLRGAMRRVSPKDSASISQSGHRAVRGGIRRL